MTNLTFSQELAIAFYSSKESHPVDLDDAWRWLGYSTKQKALQSLKSNFEEGQDFLTKRVKSSTGGRPSDLILLTVDCFKSLGMMAGTSQGKAIRKYFLECERLAKSQPAPEPKKAVSYYTDRIVDLPKRLSCPSGYWAVIEECGHLLLDVERAGYPVDRYDLLDGSVGRRYSDFRKVNNISNPTAIAKYKVDACPKPVEITVYPYSEMGIFKQWLKEVYMVNHLPKYLQDKYGKLAKVK